MLPEHILLALLRNGTCTAAEILLGTGLTLDTVRELVVAQLRSSSPTDQEADRTTPTEESAVAAARQVEIRIDGDEVQIVMSDAETIERGKRIMRLAGGAVSLETVDAITLMQVCTIVLHGLARLEARLDLLRPRDDPA